MNISGFPRNCEWVIRPGQRCARRGRIRHVLTLFGLEVEVRWLCRQHNERAWHDYLEWVDEHPYDAPYSDVNSR